MRFTSLYSPSYARQEAVAKKFWERCWRILLLVLAIHIAVFSLLSVQRKSKNELNDEMQINLSNPVTIPKSLVEKMILPSSEEKQSAASSNSESTNLIMQTSPIQAPLSADNTPVVKFNEEVIKPMQAIKPIKVEPIQEKILPVIEVQKSEQKKPHLQIEAPVQVQEIKSAEVKLAEPKPAEVIAPALPALVDKKNQDKDSPEVAQPTRGSGSQLSSSTDNAKSSPTSSRASGGIKGGAQSGGQSGLQSSSQPSAQAPSANNEMQAQVSAGKASSVGSSSGTADADYRSESLRNAQPRYPIYARKMHQEGAVVITTEVLIDGSATEVRIATSSGIKLLDEAALETVKQWRFIPAKKDGVPYVQRLRIPITFSLNNK